MRDSSRKAREERAIDALIAAALTGDPDSLPEACEDAAHCLTKEDVETLEALGPSFVHAIIAGAQPPADPATPTPDAASAPQLLGAMNRMSRDGDITTAARTEMDEKMRALKAARGHERR